MPPGTAPPHNELLPLSTALPPVVMSDLPCRHTVAHWIATYGPSRTAMAVAVKHIGRSCEGGV